MRASNTMYELIAFVAVFLLVGWWLCKPPKTRQTTFCWCPECGVDLCSQKTSLVRDDEFVEYRCECCGCESDWLFDAPVPLMARYRPTTL